MMVTTGLDAEKRKEVMTKTEETRQRQSEYLAVADGAEKNIAGIVLKGELAIGRGLGVAGGPFASFVISNCGFDLYGGVQTPVLEASLSPFAFFDWGVTYGQRDRSGWAVQGWFLETSSPVGEYWTGYAEVLLYPPTNVSYSWKLWSADFDWFGLCSLT
jgi:hypothetical protein